MRSYRLQFLIALVADKEGSSWVCLLGVHLELEKKCIYNMEHETAVERDSHNTLLRSK